MKEENLINVGLYGDGSRNSRLRAKYIYCEHANECSAHKLGKCFCVPTLFGRTCKLGTVETVDGGTKRSKAYSRVWSAAKNSGCYAKLSYPSHEYITTIGEQIFLTIPHISIKEENGNILVEPPGFSSRGFHMQRERMNPELLHRICSFVPRAMMGGVIEDYQEKIVPMVLYQLSVLMPEEYKVFTERYPEYKDKQPNWVGRWAKLSTCNRDETYKDCHGNVFHFENDFLVCEDYRSSFLPFSAKKTEIRARVTDGMQVKIERNSQVLPDTVFV